MSQPYVDGITCPVTHNLASSLTAGQITAGQDTLTISVVCPDRWFFGDFAVVTGRDGRAFAGEVEAMDVCTGQVTIRGAGQMSARTIPLPGLREPGQRRAVPRHWHISVYPAGSSRLHQPSSPVTGPWRGAVALPELAAAMVPTHAGLAGPALAGLRFGTAHGVRPGDGGRADQLGRGDSAPDPPACTAVPARPMPGTRRESPQPGPSACVKSRRWCHPRALVVGDRSSRRSTSFRAV